MTSGKADYERSEEINFEGMIHAPENEQGVVLLFSKVHRRLGFPIIDRIQTGFPDCWAMRRTPSGTKRTWIEFEFESNAFKRHVKELKRLRPRHGFVVCWEHNWPECEKYADVIDLRSQLGIGRRVWVQSTLPKFQAELDNTPMRRKEGWEWTVANRAKPGDILLMWRAGNKGQANVWVADPDLLQSFANVFEVTSKPKRDMDWGRLACVRQIASLKQPLHWGKIKVDAVLKNAPFVRANMQGRPDVTSYWWRLYQLMVDLNPGLKLNRRFQQIHPSRF